MAEFVSTFQESGKVNWDFWMTSSSDRAMDFLEDFEKIQESLGENVTFTPHYIFWNCPYCDEQYINKDCFGGGKYCAVEPSNTMIRG